MNHIELLIQRYENLKSCQTDIESACEEIISAFERGNKLLICGNGGSCSDSYHIAGELMKGFLKKRPVSETEKNEMKKREPSLSDDTLSKLQKGLPTVVLSDLVALNTAFANDVDPNLMFAQQLFGLGKEGDVLLGISTSGNAKNVAEAVRVAKAMGIKVVGLTGGKGGLLKELSDVSIIVPESETYKVQELHLPVYHAICATAEEHFFKE
ncbi:MAG: SIS domain-containing protein [Acutalibacteraceae bacterium]|nr:SIS domain-containing protein [Acutalibacteraceae bacterium]